MIKKQEIYIKLFSSLTCTTYHVNNMILCFKEKYVKLFYNVHVPNCEDIVYDIHPMLPCNNQYIVINIKINGKNIYSKKKMS